MAATVSALPPTPGSSTTILSQHKPRRSTLVRRREDDDDTLPSSPAKRSRVSFDSDVEVRMFRENELPPELIQEEVSSAFQRRANGDSAGYEKIKDIYTPATDDEDDRSPATLRCYSSTLLRHIPSLNRSA